jgi:tetratricopeptide (TPR) repeat protein
MIRLRAALFLLASSFLLLCSESAAGQEAYPEIVPLPVAFTLADMREPLPVETLIDAALLFSGAREDSLPSQRQTLFSEIEGLRGAAAGINDQAQLAELALTYMHQKILKAYSYPQARVDAALDTGVFNCVSSAVLYLIFARSLGLSVGGARTNDHAFCTVSVDGNPVDVETTNPYGFNPGQKKEFKDQFGKTTGFSYVPPSNYSDRRSIGEKDLLVLILYDRASLATRTRDFLAAINPAATAYQVVPTEEFLHLLILSVSNYTAWLGQTGDFQRAQGLLLAVESAYGENKELEQRRSELFHNQALTLIENGNLEEADALLGESPDGTPIDERDWLDISAFVVMKKAEIGSRKAGFSEGSRIIASGMEKLGRMPILLGSFEAYVHNASAEQFNERNYTQARKTLAAGLVVYPESSMLKRDLRLLDDAVHRKP